MIQFKNKTIDFTFTDTYDVIINNKKVTNEYPKISAKNANSIIQVINEKINEKIDAQDLRDFFTQVNENFLLYHLAINLKKINCSTYTISRSPSTLDKLKESLHRDVCSILYDAKEFIENDLTSNLYLDILEDVASIYNYSDISYYDILEYYNENGEIQSIYENFNKYDSTIVPVASDIIRQYDQRLKKHIDKYQKDLEFALNLIKEEGPALVNWTQHKISRRLNSNKEVSNTYFVSHLIQNKISELKKQGVKEAPKKVNSRKEKILSKKYEDMSQEELIYAFKNDTNERKALSLMNSESIVALLESKLKVVINKLYNIKWNRSQNASLFLTAILKLDNSRKNYNLVLDITLKYNINLDIDFLNNFVEFIDHKITTEIKEGYSNNFLINTIKIEDKYNFSKKLNNKLYKQLKDVEDITDIKIPFRNIVLEKLSKDEFIKVLKKSQENSNRLENLHYFINEKNHESILKRMSLIDLKEFVDPEYDAEVISLNNKYIEDFMSFATNEMVIEYIKEHSINYYFDAKKFFSNKLHMQMLQNLTNEELAFLLESLNDDKASKIIDLMELSVMDCMKFLKVYPSKIVFKRLYKLDSKACMRLLSDQEYSLAILPLAKMSNEDKLKLINLNYFAQGQEDSLVNLLFKGITREELATTVFFELDNINEDYYHNFDIVKDHAPHVLSQNEIELIVESKDFKFIIQNIDMIDSQIIKKYLGELEQASIKEAVIKYFTKKQNGYASRYSYRQKTTIDLRNTNVRRSYKKIIAKVA